MEAPVERSRNAWIMVLAGTILLACIISASVLYGGAPCTCTPGAVTCSGSDHIPVFPDPVAKQQELSSPAYSDQLYREAVLYEPLLATPGTQAHMGFYSGRGNHGSLLRLLDAINDAPSVPGTAPNRAIWAQGINAYYPYPSWERVMNEHWYERAYPVNGSVMIFGKPYADPYPVTPAQADAIWALYSARFTETAEPIARATGKPVKAWCYVEGAKANRIFYTSELPALKRLEERGIVEVYFAKSQQAAWDNPADWLNGTANAPVPVS